MTPAGIVGLSTFTVTEFGGVGDGKSVKGAVTVAGSEIIAINGGTFTPEGDEGKLIVINGAGPSNSDLITTIMAVNSPTEIEVADAASETIDAQNAAFYTYGTDNTQAFNDFWMALEGATLQKYLNDKQRDVANFISNVVGFIPPGYYMQASNGIRGGGNNTPMNTGGRCITIYGHGSSTTTIHTVSDAYFCEFPNIAPVSNSFDIRDIKHIGGKGLYLNRATGAAGQAYQSFDRLTILDYSELAIGSYWGDSPRWTVTNSIIETIRPNTKAILLPAGVANPDLSNTTITGNRYKVVTTNKNIALSRIAGLTLFNLPDDDHEADIWLQPVDSTLNGFSNAGSGLVIENNRFSNENRKGKPVVLIAEALNNVDDYHTLNHSSDPTNHILRDWSFEGNMVAGSGNTDNEDESVTGPMIRTYTADIGATTIRNNKINAGFTYILDDQSQLPGQEDVLTSGQTPVGYGSNREIGPNKFLGAGERPLPSNKSFGVFLDEYEEIGSPGTPFKGDGGYDINYEILSLVGSAPAHSSTLTLIGSTSRTPVMDALGGTNAGEFTYTMGDGSDAIQIPVPLVSAIGTNNCFIELDIKQAASRSMTEVDIQIKAFITGGGETTRRGVIPISRWKKIRIPFNTNADLTSLQIRILPSPDGFVAGGKDKVQIGRAVAYIANRPVNREHIFTEGAAYNGAHVKMNGPAFGNNVSIFPNWTSNQLFAKFGDVPSNETDGGLIPLMAAAGAGQDWTPTLVGASTEGEVNYNINEGRYFEIGKLILGFARINWDGHTGTGSMRINGLPLPVRNNATSRGVFLPIHSNLTLSVNKTLTGFCRHGTSQILVAETGDTGDTFIALPNSGIVFFAFAYEAA